MLEILMRDFSISNSNPKNFQNKKLNLAKANNQQYGEKLSPFFHYFSPDTHLNQNKQKLISNKKPENSFTLSPVTESSKYPEPFSSNNCLVSSCRLPWTETSLFPFGIFASSSAFKFVEDASHNVYCGRFCFKMWVWARAEQHRDKFLIFPAEICNFVSRKTAKERWLIKPNFECDLVKYGYTTIWLSIELKRVKGLNFLPELAVSPTNSLQRATATIRNSRLSVKNFKAAITRIALQEKIQIKHENLNEKLLFAYCSGECTVRNNAINFSGAVCPKICCRRRRSVLLN